MLSFGVRNIWKLSLHQWDSINEWKEIYFRDTFMYFMNKEKSSWISVLNYSVFTYCYFGCLSSQSNDGSSFWVAFCEEKITAEEVIKATKSGSFELAFYQVWFWRCSSLPPRQKSPWVNSLSAEKSRCNLSDKKVSSHIFTWILNSKYVSKQHATFWISLRLTRNLSTIKSQILEDLG